MNAYFYSQEEAVKHVGKHIVLPLLPPPWKTFHHHFRKLFKTPRKQTGPLSVLEIFSGGFSENLQLSYWEKAQRITKIPSDIFIQSQFFLINKYFLRII